MRGKVPREGLEDEDVERAFEERQDRGAGVAGEYLP